MSTVKADNFTWKTGEATAQSGTTVTGPQIVYGVAKAWVSFTTITTTTVRASFNISSLTDNGTGDTSINFTNALYDINYSSTGGPGDRDGGSGYGQVMTFGQAGSSYQAPTTTVIRVTCRYGAGNGANDNYNNSITIHR